MVICNTTSKPVTSDLVLVVLQGTQDAECEHRLEEVYVRNSKVIDLLSSDDGPFPIPVVTAVSLSSSPTMNLHAGRKVIAVVTDVLMKSLNEVQELHISAMFTIGDEEVAFMKKFFQASLEFVGHNAGKRKRQWKDVTSEYVSSLEAAAVDSKM